MITQLISETNQNKLTAKINDVVTTAVQSVFGEDITFEMIISSKNNTVQAVPTFFNKGIVENPKVTQGGGMLAIASLALRVVLLTLVKDRTDIMILDEPMGALSTTGGCMDRGVQLLRTISEKLGIQMLIVTHGEEVKEIADRVFYVSMKEKGNSKIITKDNIKEVLQEDV
jgi:ABC-type sugar transport system ATPase subunit